MPSNQNCRLCHSEQVNLFCQDKRRRYLRCQQCLLVFVEKDALLSQAQEKAIYDLHQNNPLDSGYRHFLGRLAAPLLERLGNFEQQGIDFGCGPGPTLSLMLEEAGHKTALYDPFYYPDKSVLARQYDFVTCTEAIEHFHHPQKEWRLLLSLLKPGGWLGIMTKLVTDQTAFARWHYKNDLSHVSFFSRATFGHLSQSSGLACEFVGDDVVLLQKPTSSER